MDEEVDDIEIFGELLLTTVKILKEDREELITPESQDMAGLDKFAAETLFARIAISLRFSEKSKAFQLRGLVENWSSRQTVREMY